MEPTDPLDQVPGRVGRSSAAPQHRTRLLGEGRREVSAIPLGSRAKLEPSWNWREGGFQAGSSLLTCAASQDSPAAALQELETQYSPSRWSPSLDKDAVIEAHVQAVSEGTQIAQAATQTLLNVPYGLGEGEKLDVYLPKELSETFPLVLYIHGGYWQFLSKDISGFAAKPLVTHGIALAAVGYDVAPKGQLEVMVRQVRRSVAFAVQQYTGISGVYLLGHSAGAHLAAMVLSTDWTEFGVVPNIKGAFLVSGVYDLEPIIHTYVNDVLNMSREVAQVNSPLRCVPKLEGKRAFKVLVTVAQHDSPEFRRQSQEYFEALRVAGWSATLLDIADTDHFNVIEKLSQQDYLLTQMILEMISRG